ncbi:MAG TPA: hypothetical protein VLC74_04915 [Rhizomicrobium sp.]|nr:hypothetical protein [Rhizomicrobium sp.]
MRSRAMILAGAASAVLAGALLAPVYGSSHHRAPAFHSSSQESTPAERQQTAELNRQQLMQAQAATAGSSTPQNGLITTPADYQRSRPANSDSSAGYSGSGPATGSAGAEGVTEDRNVGVPAKVSPAGNPSGAATPPPVNPSTTPQ